MIILNILLLALIDSLLSFDNAIALAVIVKKLPNSQQKKAITYGIAGAFVFRLLAVLFVMSIIDNWWLKLVGGSYLIYLGIGGLYGKTDEEPRSASVYNFWKTVLIVEVTDMMFSIDSITAGVAFSSNPYVVVLGGILGICVMRFASTLFLDLMKKFPNLEKTSFFLILIVGAKLLSQMFWSLDFDSFTVEACSFWISLGIALIYGFIPQRSLVQKSGGF